MSKNWEQSHSTYIALMKSYSRRSEEEIDNSTMSWISTLKWGVLQLNWSSHRYICTDWISRCDLSRLHSSLSRAPNEWKGWTGHRHHSRVMKSGTDFPCCILGYMSQVCPSQLLKSIFFFPGRRDVKSCWLRLMVNSNLGGDKDGEEFVYKKGLLPPFVRYRWSGTAFCSTSSSWLDQRTHRSSAGIYTRQLYEET